MWGLCRTSRVLACDSCPADVASTPRFHIWQAADSIFEIHMRAEKAPATSSDRLLAALHRLEMPLGRAAAGFVRTLREYETATSHPHPLVTQTIRASIPLP